MKNIAWRWYVSIVGGWRPAASIDRGVRAGLRGQLVDRHGTQGHRSTRHERPAGSVLAGPPGQESTGIVPIRVDGVGSHAGVVARAFVGGECTRKREVVPWPGRGGVGRRPFGESGPIHEGVLDPDASVGLAVGEVLT